MISAPRLSHCVFDPQNNLVFRECNTIQGYSTSAFRSHESRILPWGQLVSDLHNSCSALKILAIRDDSGFSAEETLSAWPPLLQLQILRFTKVAHKTVNTFLSRINAPNLKVVELVGNSIYTETETTSIADIELSTIELPPGVNWSLRFKHSTLKDIRETLERIEIQLPPVVEIDIMGLIPRDTLTAQFGSSLVEGSQTGVNALSNSKTLKQRLEKGWVWILDRTPSVIWVIDRGGGHWVPLTPSQPPSLLEGAKYILSATARRVEYERFCKNPWPMDKSS
ncbi:hypothetical protein M407DRAFT_21075 [Tulasnella calospora MUT 4182]|uniref:Uncharacterized protein n=1 Tax=Tulasnella calospora MUT 4182 TaxID=1051891 RepID=A0A0C3L7M1_9AGAM|nr:hypothetical protein M407DRAFT_21075 [Tulasnella calospora MUT 4182]